MIASVDAMANAGNRRPDKGVAARLRLSFAPARRTVARPPSRVPGVAPTRRLLRSRCGFRAANTGKRRSRLRYTRSEEHTSELQSRQYLVCRLLLEKKKTEH